MISYLSGCLAIAFYLAGSVAAFSLIGVFDPEARKLRQLTLAAILFHALTIVLQFWSGEGLDFGIFLVTSVTFWLPPTILLLLRERVEGLLLVVLPLSALAIAASLWLEDSPAPLDLSEPEFALHILLSLLGYTLLFMSALQSVLVLIVDHSMHRHRVSALTRFLPPLISMETLLFKLVTLGFALMTLGIILGLLFLLTSPESAWSEHILPSSIAWLLFLCLLAGRRFLGWRGTTATSWTLLAFGLLAAGYLGNRFLVEVVL